MKPKEDPAEKAARLRERRMSELELTKATENNAASMSSDLRATYKFGSIFPKASNPSVFTGAGKRP